MGSNASANPQGRCVSQSLQDLKKELIAAIDWSVDNGTNDAAAFAARVKVVAASFMQPTTVYLR
jgi:hypothetical protein